MSADLFSSGEDAAQARAAPPASAPRALDPIFARLARSTFRRRFRLGADDVAYLARHGLPVVLDHARRFVSLRLAPAQPRNDGRQTPFRGHPVFVAQHATACCCRSCLRKWHDIPAGRRLDAAEIDHVLAVLARWLEAEVRRPESP